jgi:MinD-like ATPase involved in chromosome partitioning or flagellar assembly
MKRQEMTDNYDFRSRYLLSTTGERHEPGPPVTDPGDDVAMPVPQMPEPAAVGPPPPAREPDQHSYHPGPVRTPEFTPAPATYQGPPSASEQALVTPQPARPPAPGAGHPYSAPAAAPAPIPPMPRLEERHAPPPPAQQWTPAVDPQQRWAPQADAHTGGESIRHIQVAEVAKTRREPPTIGWRKAVYTATGRQVNLGAGKHESDLLDWTARITANIPGNYQIATVSMKGGVGKTRVTAAVGSVFAHHRGGGVIAVDADDTGGRLGGLIDPSTTATVREFLADPDALTHPKTRAYTGRNRQRLEVLASYQNVASEFAFDKQAFFETIGRTRQIYQLALVDCGAMKGDVVKAVLSSSDALMIVGSCTVDGGLMVEKTVDWLAARRGHELLKRSVIVLNDANRSAAPRFISHVKETVGKRVKAVLTVPWDPHLRDAATLDFPALRKNTQEALLALAAQLADGFATAGALSG